MIKQWYTKFCAQPHQPFFTSGVLFLILFLAILFASYSNLIAIQSDVLTFHAYAFIFVIFLQFFLGFLFVVFPRFLMQANIESSVYMKHFLFYFLGTLLLFIGLLVSKTVVQLAMVVLFLTQLTSFILLYLMYKKSLMKDKYDTKWVLVGFGSGVIAHFLFIFSAFLEITLLEKLAVYMGFYLFLFVIVFTISQRMIPFFTSMKVAGYNINKSKNLMEKVYILLVLKVVLTMFDNPSLMILSDLPLLVLFAYELYRWKLPLLKVDAIMWVLYLSLYWIVIGFFIASLQALLSLLSIDLFFEKASLHALAVGYFVTVLIGFGTRVVLGHSGQTPHADKWAVAMFIFLQFVVLVRLWASFSLNFSMDYIFWINHSALLLILALCAWSMKYLHILIKGYKPTY